MFSPSSLFDLFCESERRGGEEQKKAQKKLKGFFCRNCKLESEKRLTKPIGEQWNASGAWRMEPQEHVKGLRKWKVLLMNNGIMEWFPLKRQPTKASLFYLHYQLSLNKKWSNIFCRRQIWAQLCGFSTLQQYISCQITFAIKHCAIPKVLPGITVF